MKLSERLKNVARLTDVLDKIADFNDLITMAEKLEATQHTPELEWEKARQWLSDMSNQYYNMGVSTIGIQATLEKLWGRFNDGERTPDLYTSIMAIK